jgi:5-methylthioadenosine/S-adenosylhomocysteine deaminase
MEILLKNGILLLPTKPFTLKRLDMRISGKFISEIGAGLSDSGTDEIIDCKKKLIMPGLVNAHAHSATSLLRGVGDDLQLHDWLESAIWPREKKMDGEDAYWGAKLAIAEMIRSGTTNFNDMYFHMDNVAQAVSESGIRATLG